MITHDYLRAMARYNRWQNSAIFASAGSLTEAQRREDRGAFWGSIHGTLSHVYWADRIWMSRLGVADAPGGGMKDSPALVEKWDDLRREREVLDDHIVDWADGFATGLVSGRLAWFSGVLQREVEMPLGVIVAHIFNHQTHHRGQAHALITGHGGTTSETDLFLMPADLWPPDWDAAQP